MGIPIEGPSAICGWLQGGQRSLPADTRSQIRRRRCGWLGLETPETDAPRNYR